MLHELKIWGNLGFKNGTHIVNILLWALSLRCLCCWEVRISFQLWGICEGVRNWCKWALHNCLSMPRAVCRSFFLSCVCAVAIVKYSVINLLCTINEGREAEFRFFGNRLKYRTDGGVLQHLFGKMCYLLHNPKYVFFTFKIFGSWFWGFLLNRFLNQEGERQLYFKTYLTCY